MAGKGSLFWLVKSIPNILGFQNSFHNVRTNGISFSLCECALCTSLCFTGCDKCVRVQGYSDFKFLKFGSTWFVVYIDFSLRRMISEVAWERQLFLAASKSTRNPHWDANVFVAKGNNILTMTFGIWTGWLWFLVKWLWSSLDLSDIRHLVVIKHMRLFNLILLWYHVLLGLISKSLQPLASPLRWFWSKERIIMQNKLPLVICNCDVEEALRNGFDFQLRLCNEEPNKYIVDENQHP